MTHEICDACETVAHCMKSGCVPIQPAPVEKPVGYADSRDLAKDGNWDTLIVKHASEMRKGLRFDVPLYTTPPAAQRPWVGLTDEDVAVVLTGDASLATRLDELTPSWIELTRAIEAKLKEKNT